MAHWARRTTRSSSQINAPEPEGEIGLDDRASVPDIESGVASNGREVPEVRAQVRELSNAEAFYLDRLQNLKGSWLTGDQINRLKVWPKFFESPDKSGKELRDGFLTLWTTFIVAESLLAGVAIQPFISKPNLSGWHVEVYGMLWMLTLIFDYMGLSVTVIFLGFLINAPVKLSYFWLCNLGAWTGVPQFLVIFCALLSGVAIGFSSWVIYGHKVGIVCVSVEGFIIIFALVASMYLREASADVLALNVLPLKQDVLALN